MLGLDQKLKNDRDKVENTSHKRRLVTKDNEDNLGRACELVECDRRITVLEVEKYRKSGLHAFSAKHKRMIKRTALTRDKLTKLHCHPFRHSLYGPDLSPCNYHMFGLLRETLGEEGFEMTLKASI